MAQEDFSGSQLFPALSDSDYSQQSSSSPSQAAIDVAVLEKRLEGLRDTQESVQGLSLWCQANNKAAGSIIIDTWLRVLKKSPIEKRLTMFYLANDVVQHAKRKNQTQIVNLWAFAIQKATPQVRSPSSVSSAIARIFKIWEERSIYSKEAVADLMALLHKSPGGGSQSQSMSGSKRDSTSYKQHHPENSTNSNSAEEDKHRGPPETYTASEVQLNGFQPNTFVSKIRQAYRLKSHLGVTFKTKPYVNMTSQALISTIRSRQHGLQVLNELTSLTDQLRQSEAKLINEVEERRKIVQMTETALVYYERLRSDSKVVSNAYRAFFSNVGETMDKVKEKLRVFDEMEGDMVLSMSPPRLSPPPEIPNFIPYQVLQATNSNNNRNDDFSSSQGHSGNAQSPASSSSSSMMDMNPFSWPTNNNVQPFGMGSVNSSQQSYIPQQQHMLTMFQEFQQQSGMFNSYIVDSPNSSASPAAFNSLNNTPILNDISNIPLPPAPLPPPPPPPPPSQSLNQSSSSDNSDLVSPGISVGASPTSLHTPSSSHHSIPPIMLSTLMSQTMDNSNNSNNTNNNVHPFDNTSRNMASPFLSNRGMRRPFRSNYSQSGSGRGAGNPNLTPLGGGGMRGRGARFSNNTSVNLTPRGNSFNRGRPNFRSRGLSRPF